jgi:hypothetical protein
MSGETTELMSEICLTSRSAAAREALGASGRAMLAAYVAGYEPGPIV